MITASVCCIHAHQKEPAQRVVKGLQRHGIKILEPFKQADIAIVWGVRRPLLMRHGQHALVMERAYLGDRHLWCALGWNGLNGFAKFCNDDVPDDRWNVYWRSDLRDDDGKGHEMLIIGQVMGDASLQGADINGWCLQVAKELGKQGIPWSYRPHPRAVEKKQVAPLPCDTRSLDEAFMTARKVITYSSNVGVLAAMAGKQVTAETDMSMVRKIAGKGWRDDSPLGDRKEWGRKIAYTQWLPDEIENGDFWPTLGRLFK